MQKIKLITDSACDLPKEITQKHNITVVPIPISVDDKAYLDGIDFTNEEFWRILKASAKIPSTAAILHYDYVKEYKKAMDEGFTHIINVTINSAGSKINESANMARDVFFEEQGEKAKDIKIAVIDSHTYTVAYGYALIEAAQRIEEGISFEEILEFLDDWFKRVEICFSVYTLEHIKKSGRLSVAAAFMGELLGLKPIIRILDGVPEITDKARGDKNVIPYIEKNVENRIYDKNTPVIIFHAETKDKAQELSVLINEKINPKSISIYPSGAAISINGGPNLIGICYLGEKRRVN